MKDQLRRFIEDNLMTGDERALGDNDQLLMDGIIDSLGVTRLIAFIGTDLGIDVPARDATIDNFESLAVITNYLEARRADVST